jgi:hypothetical protein
VPLGRVPLGAGVVPLGRVPLGVGIVPLGKVPLGNGIVELGRGITGHVCYSVANACEKGTTVHIYTDGERAYIEKLEEPKL